MPDAAHVTDQLRLLYSCCNHTVVFVGLVSRLSQNRTIFAIVAMTFMCACITEIKIIVKKNGDCILQANAKRAVRERCVLVYACEISDRSAN